MTADEIDRLITFLRTKMCRPCRDGTPNPEHHGCCEASELIETMRRDG